MSLVVGLKLKRALCIKMLRNSFKRLRGKHISAIDLVKIAASGTISLYLVLLDLCLVYWYCEMFVFYLSTNETAGLFKRQNSKNDYAILNMYVNIM